MISCICVTGSTRINSHVRADLLWRMVNSMHEDPGRAFELILVDNCHGPGPHRDAINDIFETWNTVTHVVRNRQNAFHGGGVNQGVAMADGDILVQITDDLEWSPKWLSDLLAPLTFLGESNRIIAAPMKGHNASGRFLERLKVGDRIYEARSNAAAYCWAFWRSAWDEVGPWRRAHFADTRWSKLAQSKGYRFVIPTWRIARETNLNFLRPWNYSAERGLNALARKRDHVDKIFWEGKFAAKDPHRPSKQWPLRNPIGIGPGCYPDEFLEEHGVK